jgi:transposase
MNKYYDPEFKARAVRLVQQQRSDYPSMTAVCRAIGDELGVSRETLRNWARQATIDAGEAPGVTTGENEEIRRLRTENKRLRESNEILKAPNGFLRRGTRPEETADHRVHRPDEKPGLRKSSRSAGSFLRAGRGNRGADLPTRQGLRPVGQSSL